MSSRSLNKVLLIGNLTRDPELRYTPQGTAVCTIGLATNRSWTSGEGGERNEETEFHRLVAWSKLAEICGQLLKKGRKVYVEGRLQTREWTGQDGQKRNVTEIVMDNMILLDSNKGAAAGDAGDTSSYAYPSNDKADTKSADATQAAPAAPASKSKRKKKGASEDTVKESEPVVAEDISDDIPF
ncbi:MAG TPA: single-stranded DNA-binding protein [Candidatus Pacebacteria bacterium]|nr:MAG: Single-stranded DNA-binding protein [Microgenomates group bacterium GW2011_GWB1_45_17]KKU24169.1 MAG: Single-stranded DNA-binding protein [Microgenomates group bacterium GW2011_GWC1_46_15]KKU24884.1 MAG: Single-stranded DNA-binding protein [Microgenomates group bacterium GW2011_GWA1_46_15]HAV14741.1 single-stranded DNA-binding protein [Candidatus Paceibacterota bacterium]HCR92716.1 single-stranded DNA-binding protein [Candidatus Paceibacterota bacterium]